MSLWFGKSVRGTLQIGSRRLNAKQRIQQCYMVMQDVNHQLFTESVEEEILLSLSGKDKKSDKKQTDRILSNLNLLEFRTFHPMSLSGGQKQKVARVDLSRGNSAFKYRFEKVKKVNLLSCMVLSAEEGSHSPLGERTTAAGSTTAYLWVVGKCALSLGES